MQYTSKFPTGTVKYWHNTAFAQIDQILDRQHCIIITDTNVAHHHSALFEGCKAVITIHAGEEYKTLDTVHTITQQLLEHQAHRKTTILGMGGGLITDLAGFVACTYMRGLPYGFVPTTLLGMVDAAVGGKNGVNFGKQKNLLGNIHQPNFILFDSNLLQTLPDTEWSNGFAEVIKYACLFDEGLFHQLEQNDIAYYQNNKGALAALIATCVDWKNKIVQSDEQEHGTRKLLNFGHTAGHAIETYYQIPHGQAVALGMLVACTLSIETNNLPAEIQIRLSKILTQYKLPTTHELNVPELMQILRMDKKRTEEQIDYVVLDAIGKASIKTISFDTITKALNNFQHAGHR